MGFLCIFSYNSSRKYTPIGSSTTDVQMEEGRRRLPEDESKTMYDIRIKGKVN